MHNTKTHSAPHDCLARDVGRCSDVFNMERCRLAVGFHLRRVEVKGLVPVCTIRGYPVGGPSSWSNASLGLLNEPAEGRATYLSAEDDVGGEGGCG
jgi:hypothetical protein